MSGFVNPTLPNLADFTTFVYSATQTPTGAPIPTSALPTNSPYIGYAYNVALALAYQGLQFIAPGIYVLAVYNLGLDRLINFAPDQTGQTYFATLRSSPPTGYGINNFVPGVVTAASDVSTSSTLTAPGFMQHLTLSDLQRLKTPFGLTYLSFVQDMGTLWGMS